jgi:hypothetical protein
MAMAGWDRLGAEQSPVISVESLDRPDFNKMPSTGWPNSRQQGVFS